jgi:DNA-binding GntR family transcriptional regulator
MSVQAMLQATDWEEWLKLEEADGSVPRYVRLQDRIRSLVREMPAGTVLPGEIECAAYAGVSRETIRKAFGNLVTEGVLVSKRGQGTFTSVPRIQTGLNRVQGFTDAVISSGRVPSTTLVRLDRELPDRKVRDALKMGRADEAWVVERIRHIDDQPSMVETAYLSAARFPKLDSHDLTGSLYNLLDQVYRLSPEYGDESISAVNADRTLARQLDVPIACALIYSVRRSYDLGRVPLEFTVRYVRPELCSFAVSLSESGAMRVEASGIRTD